MASVASGKTIQIDPPRHQREARRERVSARVDGVDVWIESDDLPLVAVPEAFVSAFLIPGLMRRARIRTDATVDAVWASHTPALLSILRDWWKLPELAPETAGTHGDTRGVPAPGESVLFFSGGTDSFYTLLRGQERVDRLLLIQGFDYELDDAPRHAAAERTLRDVAEACGKQASVVHTNLRSHPWFRHVPWEHTHGGVLAAIAHSIGGDVEQVAISASISYAYGRPWGSHWNLDPLWSSSRRNVVSVGQHFRKPHKLRALAAEPLVHRHLRVCWENRAPEGNCNGCYKCLFARLILLECGQLQNVRTLDGAESLARDIDALPRGKQRMRSYEDLLRGGRLDPEVARAVRDLIRRTRRLERPHVRLRRALLRKVLEWLRPEAE
jgi:hypothetical protein